MTELELKSFVKVVTNYFASVSGEASAMGLPSVKGRESRLLDFTGAISWER